MSPCLPDIGAPSSWCSSFHGLAVPSESPRESAILPRRLLFSTLPSFVIRDHRCEHKPITLMFIQRMLMHGVSRPLTRGPDHAPERQSSDRHWWCPWHGRGRSASVRNGGGEGCCG